MSHGTNLSNSTTGAVDDGKAVSHRPGADPIAPAFQSQAATALAGAMQRAAISEDLAAGDVLVKLQDCPTIRWLPPARGRKRHAVSTFFRLAKRGRLEVVKAGGLCTTPSAILRTFWRRAHPDVPKSRTGSASRTHAEVEAKLERAGL